MWVKNINEVYIGVMPNVVFPSVTSNIYHYIVLSLQLFSYCTTKMAF